MGELQWARAGRGMSFHEFDVAFGVGNYEVIQDGYWGNEDQQAYYKPNLAYEEALSESFRKLTPPVPRGFCRPSLNLIIQLRNNQETKQTTESISIDAIKSETVFHEFYEKGWRGLGRQ